MHRETETDMGELRVTVKSRSGQIVTIPISRLQEWRAYDDSKTEDEVEEEKRILSIMRRIIQKVSGLSYPAALT